MKHKLLILFFLGFYARTLSAQNFISEPKILEAVEQKLEKRKLQFPHMNFNFQVRFNQKLELRELEALKFLYAYMSLNDLVDKNTEYYLKQIRVAFEAQQTFSWGKTVPEDLFRHFVLPPRVNNEDLDTARILFFNELKPRIMNLSMYDAALEVNHWCHEKLAYRGADERTSSPLASMLTALGRCGEESTFAVTALRAVGIPARQCYTPRWAHTDDNHAWVEVWIDGKWYFLGACEPDPELNMGWFAQPAKRTMMVHTNVFGPYKGKEETLLYDPNYTKINLIENYATTKTIYVKVLNSLGKTVPQSTVKFQLYNYAEFYTIAEQKTDAKGVAKITTGLGDLMIWATSGKQFGYKKISVSEVDTVVITVINTTPKLDIEQFVNIPPVSKQLTPVSTDKAKANSLRLQYEDSVRTAYTSTFVRREKLDDLFRGVAISLDSIWTYIQKSEGNWREISQFIIANATNPLLFDFLDGISDKDLRDTKSKTLMSHLTNLELKTLQNKAIPYTIFKEGVVATRICNELITDWRRYFLFLFIEKEREKFRNNPLLIKDYFVKNIHILDENYSRCPISPEGVFRLHYTDLHSLNIAFVALCRTCGIPSRLNSATRIPQFYSMGRWVDVLFDQPLAETQEYCTLILENDTNNLAKPEYYSHYTIARFQNGEFATLDYESSPLVKTLPATLLLKPGFYRLTTGNRQNDGSVLIRTENFEIKPNETIRKTVTIRNIDLSKAEKPKVDFKNRVSTTDNRFINLNEHCVKKGMVLLFIDPAKEPTRHVMSDLKLLKEDFNYWDGEIVFVVPQSVMTPAFVADTTGLPKKVTYVIDYNNELLNSMKSTLKIEADFPVTMLINSKLELLFHAMGYRIGIGETLLKNIQMDANSCKK